MRTVYKICSWRSEVVDFKEKLNKAEEQKDITLRNKLSILHHSLNYSPKQISKILNIPLKRIKNLMKQNESRASEQDRTFQIKRRKFEKRRHC